tara:strand:+ start:1750 stop:2556 length:807 start_codon:yes stop_codon:yes gene_type:complete
VKITATQLRRLIESYIVDDKGNVVSADDAYDVALDTAAASIDRSREEGGKSPIGQEFLRSSDPETVVQGLEFADALDAEYSDFERIAVDMSDEDRQPNRPMGKLDSHMKAKYGQGRAMGEVYSLVVKDNMGKEVLLPIIDDHSEEEKKRGEGIPEDTMFRILDAYRKMQKAKMILRSLPDIDDEDDETYEANSPTRDRALIMFDQGEDALEHFYYNDLLSNHVWELLVNPHNYNYQSVQKFPYHEMRIEPRHKELEDALAYAAGMEWV